MSMYSFYSDGKNGIVCVSSYAGRKVRATAKCHPDDRFDYERGAALAKARVDAKIAAKRVKRAGVKNDEARATFEQVRQHCYDMTMYLTDAVKAYREARDNVKELEEKF